MRIRLSLLRDNAAIEKTELAEEAAKKSVASKSASASSPESSSAAAKGHADVSPQLSAGVEEVKPNRAKGRNEGSLYKVDLLGFYGIGIFIGFFSNLVVRAIGVTIGGKAGEGLLEIAAIKRKEERK